MVLHEFAVMGEWLKPKTDPVPVGSAPDSRRWAPQVQILLTANSYSTPWHYSGLKVNNMIKTKPFHINGRFVFHKGDWVRVVGGRARARIDAILTTL